LLTTPALDVIRVYFFYLRLSLYFHRFRCLRESGRCQICTTECVDDCLVRALSVARSNVARPLVVCLLRVTLVSCRLFVTETTGGVVSRNGRRKMRLRNLEGVF